MADIDDIDDELVNIYRKLQQGESEIERLEAAVKNAQFSLDNAQRRLDENEKALECTARKRGLTPGDEVDRLVKRIQARRRYDGQLAEARFTSIEVEDEAWVWQQACKSDDVDCTGDDCFYTSNPDRVGSYSGTYVCRFDDDIRLCNMCYDTQHHRYDLDDIYEQWRTPVYETLLDECRANYNDESVEETVKRSLDPTQWREFLSSELELDGCDYYHCLRCEGAPSEDRTKPPTGVRVLRGQPDVQLCKAHEDIVMQPDWIRAKRAIYSDCDYVGQAEPGEC